MARGKQRVFGMRKNFAPATAAHTLPGRTPAALVAYRAAYQAARTATLQAHAPQALALRTSIRATLTARANAGDAAAVMYLLMQGW